MIGRVGRRMAAVGVLSIAFVFGGVLFPLPNESGIWVGGGQAMAKGRDRPRGPIIFPRPSFKGPAVKPRPTIIRPKPNMKPMRPRPGFSGRPGDYTRPLPVRPRPSGPTTRPIFDPNTGQGVRPIPVRPGRPFPNRPGSRPPNPYPDYPNFVDMPEVIDDRPPPRPLPPGWKPPKPQRPPHFRPPHSIWGDWYWNGPFGWYHRYRFGGTLITIVLDLPRGCTNRVSSSGARVYLCNEYLYRSRYVRGYRVWEIIGSASDARASNETLRLTKPYMRGPRVLDLQRKLRKRGYNVGTIDGVFGRGTARALMQFQRDVGLAPDGVAGRATLDALG